jgi:hypothetical protein
MTLPQEEPKSPEEIFTAIAKEVLAKGGNRNHFDAAVRTQLRAMQDDGQSKESLSELRRISRAAYHAEVKKNLGLPGSVTS